MLEQRANHWKWISWHVKLSTWLYIDAKQVSMIVVYHYYYYLIFFNFELIWFSLLCELSTEGLRKLSEVNPVPHRHRVGSLSTPESKQYYLYGCGHSDRPWLGKSIHRFHHLCTVVETWWFKKEQIELALMSIRIFMY